jgi:NitT/TauT family transport system substrate-binding protein
MGALTFLRGRRAVAFGGACACLLTAAGIGVSGSSASAASGTTTIRLVLAWYPTPEYGGVYAGLKEGYFKKEGINLLVTPGGPQVSATEVVGSGQADIGYLNNDETLMEANEDGIDLTEFATTYEEYPEALEYHKSNPISTLAQANGKTISGVTGSVDYQWLQAKYHLKNTVTPFSYATFAANAKSLLLGYAPDDVPTLAAQGVAIGYVPISDSGLDPYADILFAKSPYVTANEGLIKRFLTALGEGWQYYRNHYLQVNPSIFVAADKTTPLATDNAISKFEDPFIFGGAAATAGIGSISISRVTDTYDKLRALGVLKKNLNINDIAIATLVPKLLPPAKQGS